MKERYLSKTPFLTFVYISKCNINLPCYFGNSKKRFLWTGLMCIVHIDHLPYFSDLHQVYRGVSIPAWCSQSFAQVTRFSFSFYEKIIWPRNNFWKVVGIRNFIICVWQLRCFKNELRLWKWWPECIKEAEAGFPRSLVQVGEFMNVQCSCKPSSWARICTHLFILIPLVCCQNQHIQGKKNS